MPKTSVPLLVLAMSVFAGAANTHAAQYYIAPGGNDSHPGSLDRPWRTIGRANETVRAGDTVYLRAGSHVGVIQPEASGSAGSPIVYKPYREESVSISTPADQNSAVVLSGNHIHVEGFTIRVDSPPVGRTFNVMVTGNHNVLRNLSLRGSPNYVQERGQGIREGGIVVNGGDRNLIERNLIENYSFQGLKLSGIPRFNHIRANRIQNNWGDPIRIDSSRGVIQGNLIENNYLAGSLAANGVQFNGDYSSSNKDSDVSNRGVIIRGNTIVGNAEMCIALKGTSDIVVERNVCTRHMSDNDGFTDGVHQRNSSPAIHKGDFGSSNIIIRQNIVYDNQSGINGYDNWKIYNNTVVGNNRDYDGPNSSFNPRGEPFFVGIRPAGGYRLGIKNNIICDHNSAEILLHTSTSGEVDHNLYCDRDQEADKALLDSVTRSWSSHDLRDWQAVLADLPSLSGNDQRSVSLDPLFENVPSRPVGQPGQFDFRLRENSPAIDAGGPLTHARSGGSGRDVYVRDARYFFDGYGMVEGDTIRIGDSSAVRITAIDYSQNRITVNSAITWSQNAPVSLDYSGSAPDLGAYEFTLAVPRAPLLAN